MGQAEWSSRTGGVARERHSRQRHMQILWMAARFCKFVQTCPSCEFESRIMQVTAGKVASSAASSRQACGAMSSRQVPQAMKASLARFEGLRRVSPSAQISAPLRSSKRMASSRRSSFVVESKAGARKVALLGAAGGIGQPLALLLKMQPYVAELALYDIANTVGVAADLSHCNTTVQVPYDLTVPSKDLMILKFIIFAGNWSYSLPVTDVRQAKCLGCVSRVMPEFLYESLITAL